MSFCVKIFVANKPKPRKSRILKKWYKNQRNWDIVASVTPNDSEGWLFVRDFINKLKTKGLTTVARVFH